MMTIMMALLIMIKWLLTLVCCRKVSVIGRTYRGSLPSQSGGHKEENEEEEEEEGEEKNRTELEFGGDEQFVVENDRKGEGNNWSDESDLEKEEKASIYLGELVLQDEPERSQSMCSVCSRYSSSPPHSLILPNSSSSSTSAIPQYHFSPSSPRPSLFQCRECCFDNSPLSGQLVAIPTFPSPSLGGGERRGRSQEGRKQGIEEEQKIVEGD